jgi:glycosyltransferase involved in cell wall biosynthesis
LIRRVHVELTEPRENDETAPEQPDIAKGLTPVIKKKIGPVEPPQVIAVPKKNVTDRLKSEREARREGRRKARLEKEKNRKAKKNPNPGPGSNIPVKVTRAPPKVEELVPGEDRIKNSVIISIQNRRDFLDRTLRTYARQTMPKSDFEIVIVDDNSQEDILGLCKMHAKESGLQFQYIKMDTSKGAVPQKGFTPALSNNIGFKNARGSVLIITGPETLQSERNLEYTWETCKNPICLYGVVHRSSAEFVKRIRDPEFWKSYQSFDSFFNIPGALSVRADTTGFWWYYAAAKKEYIMAMNGVDEKFMGGICGEDDDFANRMNFLGVKLEYNRKVLGIHQDHSNEDRVDPVHDIRFNKKKWKKLRAHNLALLSQCISNRDPVANKGIDWGTEKAIITKEIF